MKNLTRRAALLALSVPLCHAAERDIRGAGATFPQPVYAAWAAGYGRSTGVAVHYDAVGSGEGMERLERGGVDFGATDVPLTDAELHRLGALQFPAIIGAVVPVVHLAGIPSGALKLTGALLADIYRGRVTRWDAPAIAALNPGLALPSSHITVVHRQDASGTSHLWSDYLARSSSEWRASVGVGRTLAWPVGVGAVGNAGVASAVLRTRYAIGYVEHAYAQQHQLPTVALRNREGRFVQASRSAFEAAARQVRWQELADLKPQLIDLPGADSWPLTGASYILLRTADPQRSAEVLKFFDWAFKQGGPAAAELGYLPLPEVAVQRVIQTWPAAGR